MAEEQDVHLTKTETAVCNLCELEVETMLSYCVNCDIYKCRSCTTGHTKLKSTKDHEIYIYMIAEQTWTQNVQQKQSCLTHPGEDYRYYCTTCDMAICSDCILNNHHSYHACIKLKDAAKQKGKILSETLAEMKDANITKLKSKVKEIDKLYNDNVTQGRDTVHIIQTRIGEVVCMIKSIGEIMIKESENSTKENNKYLNQMRVRFMKELSEMKKLYVTYNKVVTFGSDLEKIVAEKEARKVLNQFNLLQHEVKIHIPKFSSEKIEISSLQRSFGSLNTDEEHASDFDHSVKEESVDVETTPKNFNVKVVSKFKHKTKRVSFICPITDSTVLIHYPGDYNNDIVNTEGHLQSTIKLDFVAYDCILTSDGIVASELNCTNFYKLTIDGQKTDVISISKAMKPLRFCMSKDGNILVSFIDEQSYEVNDYSRRLVARMTTTGQILETYEYDRGTRLFIKPTSVAETTNGDICVINRVNENAGNLVMLENKGNFKTTYPGGPINDRFDPIRVVCDKTGIIVVSDRKNMKIHLLNTNGQLLQYLMTEKELTSKPFAIAVDTRGMLWLGCEDGQMYVVKYLK